MIDQAFHARFGVGALALVALLPLPALATAAEAEEYQPTFAKDVAPLFQQKCQVCHQPNSIAPMSLLTYADARPWARAIKQKVVARDMPPWYINKHVGIQHFKNDRSLTDEQIDTIARWVDGGAPFGNEADLPAPIEWADPTEWQLAKDFGQPDLIVRSEPFSLPADGQDKWWRPTVDTGLTQARWVRAIEFKPSFPLGRRVVHHALATLIQEEDGVTKLASTAVTDDDDPFTRGGGLFMEWAVGKRGEIFPEGTGKLMLPDSTIRFEVHYHAVGEEVPNDVIELGVYFYPEGYAPESRTVLHAFQANGFDLDIAPNTIAMNEGFTVLRAPARLENFQPHMHMRGTAMSLEAIYPDGRTELINIVDNFHWNWHVNYIYDEDVAPVLPKGTVLKVTAWHDNTAANKDNPDPNQWVGYGDRTVDEMAHLWVDVTYLEDEDYKRLVEERKSKTDDN